MQLMIKKPIITEKSISLTEKNFYTFLVEKFAVKKQIAKIVADKFKVDVVKVKTINIKPKRKIQRRLRRFYNMAGFKKAIVEVKKGQKITIFETPKDTEAISSVKGEPIIMKEKKDFLGRTKVRVEKGATGAAPTTQRKVITGK